MLSNYLLFIRSPSYAIQPGPVQWREVVMMFTTYIVVSFFLGSVIQEIVVFFHLSHDLADMGPLEIWLGILVIPPVEEILFRLWLRVSRKTILIFSAVIGLVALLLTSLVSFWITVSLLCFGAFTALVVLVGNKEKIEMVAARHFGILFYLSIFIFGLAHIFNYTPLTWQIWLLAPVLVLPQFVLGSMLGFIRVRYGILYAILFHIAVNASLLSFVLFE